MFFFNFDPWDLIKKTLRIIRRFAVNSHGFSVVCRFVYRKTAEKTADSLHIYLNHFLSSVSISHLFTFLLANKKTHSFMFKYWQFVFVFFLYTIDYYLLDFFQCRAGCARFNRVYCIWLCVYVSAIKQLSATKSVCKNAVINTNNQNVNFVSSFERKMPETLFLAEDMPIICYAKTSKVLCSFHFRYIFFHWNVFFRVS